MIKKNAGKSRPSDVGGGGGAGSPRLRVFMESFYGAPEMSDSPPRQKHGRSPLGLIDGRCCSPAAPAVARVGSPSLKASDEFP